MQLVRAMGDQRCFTYVSDVLVQCHGYISGSVAMGLGAQRELGNIIPKNKVRLSDSDSRIENIYESCGIAKIVELDTPNWMTAKS